MYIYTTFIYYIQSCESNLIIEPKHKQKKKKLYGNDSESDRNLLGLGFCLGLNTFLDLYIFRIIFCLLLLLMLNKLKLTYGKCDWNLCEFSFNVCFAFPHFPFAYQPHPHPVCYLSLNAPVVCAASGNEQCVCSVGKRGKWRGALI